MVRSAAAFALCAGVTLVAYLALLGWDQQKETGPDGFQHGPYAAWQVVAVALVLAAVAWTAGRTGHTLAGVTAAALTFTLAWSVDAATDLEDDGLWPLGAAMVAAGCATVLPLVAVAARQWHARGSVTPPR